MKKIKQRIRAKLRRTLRKKRPLSETPDVECKTFFFFGGLHRSGTSLLHRLLRAHPDISGFHKTPAPQDEGQHLQDVFPKTGQRLRPGRFAFYEEAYLTENSPIISEENRDKLLREWGAYHDLSKSVLLEKSPENLLRIRFFQKLFPQSKFAVLIRHPVPVAISTIRWQQSSTLTNLIIHWYIAYMKFFQDIESYNDIKIFRYEDFISSPQRYITMLCCYLGIEPSELSEPVANHNDRYFSQWDDCAYEREILLSLLPEVPRFMSQLGYSLYDPYWVPGSELKKNKYSRHLTVLDEVSPVSPDSGAEALPIR